MERAVADKLSTMQLVQEMQNLSNHCLFQSKCKSYMILFLANFISAPCIKKILLLKYVPPYSWYFSVSEYYQRDIRAKLYSGLDAHWKESGRECNVTTRSDCVGVLMIMASQLKAAEWGAYRIVTCTWVSLAVSPLFISENAEVETWNFGDIGNVLPW